MYFIMNVIEFKNCCMNQNKTVSSIRVSAIIYIYYIELDLK